MAAQSPYEILGEQGIRDVVSAFYDIMDSNSDFAELRKMHSADLIPMKSKLADYLIGWMGGPPLYFEKHGSICMTAPHEPYAIGEKERDDWLACMYCALEATNASDELLAMLKQPLLQLADAVRND